MKIYAVAGFVLLLTSPFWVFLIMIPELKEEAAWMLMVRMRADEWSRWLGVLALVLALLQPNVNLPKQLKMVGAGIYLIGSVLIPYGTARGFGELYGGGAGAVFVVVGGCMVGFALLLNFFGLLRFRQVEKAQ